MESSPHVPIFKRSLLPSILLVLGLLSAAVLVGLVWLGSHVLASPNINPNNPYPVDSRDPRKTVAISWKSPSDAANTPVYQGLQYGAHVYTEPNATGSLDVHCVVYIGEMTYMDDIGVIGTVTSQAQAASQFGTIRWTATDLLVGNGSPSDLAVPRKRIQTHR